MSDELLSLRVMVVSGSRADREMFREAASASAVPIEVMGADAAADAVPLLHDADLVLLDGALPDAETTRLVATARAAARPPFTVLLAPAATDALPFPTDALAVKPAGLEDLKRLLEGAIRARLPSRVLLVDDSPTMRSIVRRILAATRFPLEVTEVEQGINAIEIARKINFDIVFLDHNMPGFSGLETMAEFRREKRRVSVVIMTSTPDDALAARVHAQGAIFLKKPFFPADIEAVLCGIFGLRALNPQRA